MDSGWWCREKGSSGLVEWPEWMVSMRSNGRGDGRLDGYEVWSSERKCGEGYDNG